MSTKALAKEQNMIELNIRNVTRARLRLDHSLEQKKSTLLSGHEPEAGIK